MTAEHPNLVFILPDQCGAVALPVYGNPDVRAPNLDRLAQESVVFDRAYTASPVCTPFRGTLFTGRYPTQTGVTHNGYRIPEDEVTLPQLLNQGSYTTAYVGKWHLSGPPGGNRWVPPELRAGFQTFVGWESHHVDHWQGRIWADDPDEPLPMPGHETDALTDIALDVLDTLEPPFCLFVAFQSPHPPCSPPAEMLALYQDRPVHYRPNVDESVWYDRPEWDADYDLRTFVDRYYGEITQLDGSIGRLLSRLAADGHDDDTAVVFASDHGEMMGSHGRFSKGVMYEEALRIPLMIRPPGGTPARRTDALVSSVDFMPTLLDLCGLPAAPTAEGLSYAPLVRGEDQPLREAIFAEYMDTLCIRTADAKLVADRSTGAPTAFYDLGSDPYEQRNLIGEVQADDGAYTDNGAYAGNGAPSPDALRHDLTTWYDDIRSRRGAHRQSASQPAPATDLWGCPG